MLKLEDYRVFFVAVGLVGVLLFASPSLGLILHIPSGEKYSELWILGPSHMAEGYPSNVKVNVSYLMYLGVGNHMGSSAYYGVFVKFRNQSEALPNVTAGTPSPVPALYEYRVFVQDEKSWEAPLTFSFSNVSIVENRSMVGSLTINDVAVSVDKPASWNAQNEGYYYQLFFELWIYNVEADVLQFHNRFVSRWLNMTG
jgi:uncharacterized membrane protein